LSDKNDRGPGTPAKELQFWTMPLHPIIEGSEKDSEKPWKKRMKNHGTPLFHYF
jgi:hypothetical protein